MKRIGLTHRVDYIKSYGERRDSIDQAWYDLILSMEMLPIPLPNLPDDIACKLLDALDLDGIILTGGNSISSLDCNSRDCAPERDAFESAVITYCLERNIPLIGVCRGMQVINHYFGGDFVQVEGHVATQHKIECVDNKFELPATVNSFHSWAIPISNLGNNLNMIAHDSMGNAEAFSHNRDTILGIMWHPEREKEFSSIDINLIKRIFL